MDDSTTTTTTTNATLNSTITSELAHFNEFNTSMTPEISSDNSMFLSTDDEDEDERRVSRQSDFTPPCRRGKPRQPVNFVGRIRRRFGRSLLRPRDLDPVGNNQIPHETTIDLLNAYSEQIEPTDLHNNKSTVDRKCDSTPSPKAQSSDSNSPSQSSSAKNKKLFPQKLWDLINDDQYSYCLRWSDDGQLVYLNRELFEENYLNQPHNQFNTRKAISFVRQMNMYGFRKVDDCYYENDYFKRGCDHLLKNMFRRHPNKNLKGPRPSSFGAHLKNRDLIKEHIPLIAFNFDAHQQKAVATPQPVAQLLNQHAAPPSTSLTATPNPHQMQPAYPPTQSPYTDALSAAIASMTTAAYGPLTPPNFPTSPEGSQEVMRILMSHQHLLSQLLFHLMTQANNTNDGNNF